MKSATVGVLLCTSFLWAGSAAKPLETLVITNVNIVDTRYGGVEPNVTVIVKEGVITAIAKIAIIETGVHVHVVNAKGKYLIPGLWDLNATISGDADRSRSSALSLYVVNGVTGVRDMGVRDITTHADEEARLVSDLPVPEIALPGPTLHPELATDVRSNPAKASATDRARLPGSSLHEGLELLVKTGYTPLHALQTVTFNAALFMAKLDKFGVVERGHIADLVLLDQNPLEDICNTKKIAGVVLRGTYFSRPDLDALLAQSQRVPDLDLAKSQGWSPSPERQPRRH
jgi:imidazolonepropionase-like amidohydrolase